MTLRVEVAIVGAGFAGLATAISLNRSGRREYVLLERAASVGGTWRDNTYPGIACDVPSHLYGFAEHPNPDWSGLYATGDEIRAYLERVAAIETPGRLRLDSPMTDARWSGDRWTVTVGGPDPETVEADVLVLACGRLAEPLIPALPGLDTFPGPLFHSARWDHAASLDGLHVGVVGSGASAVQLVPELARTAAHVTLFQRSPAWILPRGARAYSPAERRRFASHPDELGALRARLYDEGEARFASRSGDPAASAGMRALAEAHLAAQVADRDLRRTLTPDYAFGCKRVLLSDDFYPAVAGGAVTLVPSALAAVDGSVVTARDGSTHELDALVLATGFRAGGQPYAPFVHGETGTLAEHWADGMTAFGSTVVAGFPNLFVLNGPNAALAHNSSVLMLEEQAGYVARTLATRRGRVLRVRPDAEAAYTAAIAEAAASGPWISGGCRSWYVDRGRLTLLWPGTVEDYRERLARSAGAEFEPAHTPAAPAAPTSSQQWHAERGGETPWSRRVTADSASARGGER